MKNFSSPKSTINLVISTILLRSGIKKVSYVFGHKFRVAARGRGNHNCGMRYLVKKSDLRDRLKTRGGWWLLVIVVMTISVTERVDGDRPKTLIIIVITSNIIVKITKCILLSYICTLIINCILKNRIY